jgi:hypothetical protein
MVDERQEQMTRMYSLLRRVALVFMVINFIIGSIPVQECHMLSDSCRHHEYLNPTALQYSDLAFLNR